MSEEKSESTNKRKFDSYANLNDGHPFVYNCRDLIPTIVSFLPPHYAFMLQRVCLQFRQKCLKFVDDENKRCEQERKFSKIPIEKFFSIPRDFSFLKCVLFTEFPPFEYLAVLSFLETKEKTTFPTTLPLSWSSRLSTFKVISEENAQFCESEVKEERETTNPLSMYTYEEIDESGIYNVNNENHFAEDDGSLISKLAMFNTFTLLKERTFLDKPFFAILLVSVAISRGYLKALKILFKDPNLNQKLLSTWPGVLFSEAIVKSPIPVKDTIVEILREYHQVSARPPPINKYKDLRTCIFVEQSLAQRTGFSGSVEEVEALLSKENVYDTEPVYEFDPCNFGPCFHGCADIAKSFVFDGAMMSGNGPVLEYLHRNTDPQEIDPFHNHFLLKYMIWCKDQQKDPFFLHSSLWTVEDIEFIRYFKDKAKEMSKNNHGENNIWIDINYQPLGYAALTGNLEHLKNIFSLEEWDKEMPEYEMYEVSFFENPWTTAIMLERLDILDWLLSKRIAPSFFSIGMACFIGNKAIIRLLNENFGNCCEKLFSVIKPFINKTKEPIDNEEDAMVLFSDLPWQELEEEVEKFLKKKMNKSTPSFLFVSN